MVSDTLSDAAAEIRDYLRLSPEVYAPIKDRLQKLLREMDAIRIKLDIPPRR